MQLSFLPYAMQEASKLRKAADEVAQLRSALREAQMHSKRDLVKSQALTEEVEQLEQELEVSLRLASFRACLQCDAPMRGLLDSKPARASQTAMFSTSTWSSVMSAFY